MTTLNLTMELLHTAAGGNAGRYILQVIRSLFDGHSANGPTVLQGLLIGLAIAVAIGTLVMPIIGPAMRAGQRALVYVFERICNIVVDMVLEATILVLLAVLAGGLWLAEIFEALGKIFR
jgi:hypothetical protein